MTGCYLGLKGTFSEIERYQITARMQRGRLNRARRGEYAKPVPIGYAYDPVTGQLQFSPDQAVRHAVEQTVHLFSQLGSIRSVLLCLNREVCNCRIRSIGVALGRRSRGAVPATKWSIRC
jgi:DNA invertase Pin-like site-specific DNA recombinase